MNAKRLAVALAALVVVSLGGRSESTLAAPVNLTVDSSASYLGTALIGVPLSGSVVGDFNGTSLTFSGGSNIATTLGFNNLSGVIPSGTIFNDVIGGVFTVTLTSQGGSFEAGLPALHLDPTLGTVSNGSSASVPTWASTGGVGTVNGDVALRLRITTIVLGNTVELLDITPSVDLSAGVRPLASFNSLALFGPIGLSDVGGITLTLPFGLPMDVDNLVLDTNDLGFLGVADAFVDVSVLLFNSLNSFVEDFIGFVPIPGQVVASNVVPSAVPEPATLALLALGLAGLGFSRRRH